ncbi:GNAT family N-acetyltransferase [Planomicrobium sp. YIM 101495]|uniref:GNAT family N-acetyltransferase n=1 Tax=Planomicrobium sp. YIM 101495 TaxID=2665160 RepID=UPI0012B8BEFE|nr:GNAT family protein [Planomicrobium sp. YIM 101495]MTD31250.1 GNAT family N-acetyltransferase [Planomicrobium sp. YIM 101495]
MYKDKQLAIRPVEERDLPRLWELIYKDEAPEWKKWDAPYFPHKAIPYETFMETRTDWIGCDDFWVITVEDKVCGILSYYYEDAQQKWLEVGIVLHEAGNWSKGLGTRALTLWIEHLFQTLPTVRIGLTTWSGNARMIRVAEKLGMQMEGRMRKVRFHEGEYYDSIRMGILREEWAALLSV